MRPGLCWISTRTPRPGSTHSNLTSGCTWPDITVRPGCAAQSSRSRLHLEGQAGPSPVLVYLVWQGGRRGCHRPAFRPFRAGVEAATSFAPVRDEAIALAGVTGCLIPEFQGDAMPLGTAAVGVEHLAAGSIGAWKNPVGSRHEGHTCESSEVLARSSTAKLK